MSVTDKLKFGKPLKGLNTQKAAKIEAMRNNGMKISDSDRNWLKNYNKEKAESKKK